MQNITNKNTLWAMEMGWGSIASLIILTYQLVLKFVFLLKIVSNTDYLPSILKT